MSETVQLNRGMFTSRTDEWSTPQELFDKLHAEFDFTLDPCATDENAKCATYFTETQDGLAQSWQGHRVFCNPPYGGAIKNWVRKGYNEARKGALVVMLIPSRTDTAYWHKYVMKSTDIRFIRGRVKFGGHHWNAPFPSAVVVFRPTAFSSYEQPEQIVTERTSSKRADIGLIYEPVFDMEAAA